MYLIIISTIARFGKLPTTKYGRGSTDENTHNYNSEIVIIVSQIGNIQTTKHNLIYSWHGYIMKDVFEDISASLSAF